MNDKITISTAELFRMFPDQETARTYLEAGEKTRPPQEENSEAGVIYINPLTSASWSAMLKERSNDR